MPKNASNFFKRNSLSLLLSVGVHGLFALSVFDISLPKIQVPTLKIADEQNSNKIKLDEIKFVSREEIQKRLANIKKPTTKLSKQIVSNEDRGFKAKPNDSRFLGEKDMTYDRQMVAAKNGSFKAMGLGEKTGSEKSIAQGDAAPKISENKSSSAKKPAAKAKPINLADLALGLKNHSLTEVQEAIENPKLDQQVANHESKTKTIGALGSKNGDASKVGLAQNNDFVEEIPLGEMTQLNTQEFKYFGFYNRIKLQLEQFWGKSINDKARALYRSGRRMPASDNMITSVTVVLDEKGEIVSITINGSSGVRELDHAAVESFKKAGPFPNPPKGLVVEGRAVIQWGFVVRS